MQRVSPAPGKGRRRGVQPHGTRRSPASGHVGTPSPGSVPSVRLVARTVCLLLVGLGLYLIGDAAFTFDADVWRMLAGLLLAGVGYRIWDEVFPDQERPPQE